LHGRELPLDLMQPTDHRVVGVRPPVLGEAADPLGGIGDDSGE